MAGEGEAPALCLAPSLREPFCLDRDWVPFHGLSTVPSPSRRVTDSCGGRVLLVLCSPVEICYVQVQAGSQQGGRRWNGGDWGERGK